ncbi:MAG: alpha/beta hydrolase [Cyanobacteriota bacterium]|nr:alpha/beta hydrolase [Cyanobacteriota bacterium]
MAEHPFSLVHRIRPPQVTPTDQGSPCLVLLHGVGSHEEDLLGLAPYLDPRFFLISARAPISLGSHAYGWFEIEFTPQGIVGNPQQAQASLGQLHQFLAEVVVHYPVDPQQLYLMGFSQGGMMSLSVLFTTPHRLAGVVVMSGRFPHETLPPEPAPLLTPSLTGMPVLVVHGRQDPVLPIDMGRQMREQLQTFAVDLTYREYDMGHHVSNESLRDIVDWLSGQLDSHQR